MFLSEPLYFLFLAGVFLLYYLLEPGLPRRVLLLCASYYFYFELSNFYILVLFFVTAVVYRGALLLRSSQLGQRSFLFFGLIITLTLLPLLIFKYLGPVLALVGGSLPLVQGLQALALPIGISFFTFAALGYLIDVYLEVIEPERDWMRVSLFLAFFPLVSAGPIERAGRFIPQFDLTARFSSERSLSALRLILIGLVMKLFIAGDLEKPTDPLFATPGNCLPIEHLFGMIFYAFLLYADFGGYSLIAIGSAKLLGLDVRPNFQQPFLSASVPEFWRNWHISLSSWVRDYLFSPMRMEWRRQGNQGMAAALLLSFIILGVWHGAKWGFLVFGVMHGILVVTSVFTLARRDAFWKRMAAPPVLIYAVRVVMTFIFVMLTFVVFRTHSLVDAMVIYRGIFSVELLRELAHGSTYFLTLHNRPVDLNLIDDFTIWFGIGLLILGDVLTRKKITIEKFPGFCQIVLCYIAIIIILCKWAETNVTEAFQYYKF
jgi:D-alanyl-lipoteichoic acid acyltransferase DltB (MBOAT superfamily)